MRRLLAAALLGLPLLACSAGTGGDAASSEDALSQSKQHLLAIGDSMTFAWDPRIQKDPHQVVASNYRGYADILGDRLGLAVDNSACPGEASGSFLDAKAEDNGCRANHAAYKLHTEWGGAADQVDFVTGYLEGALAAGKPPAFIVMTIGGNDLLIVQKHCHLPGLLTGLCEVAKLPFAVHAYGEHIDRILEAIDATGYRGKVVFLTTYAPDYSDKIATFGLGRMNDELQEHARKSKESLGIDVRVADGYGAFEAAAKEHGGKTCETGLLIPNGDGTCDIHPTQAGHELIANTIQAALK
jgi:lysophospholipase L1-like esterase